MPSFRRLPVAALLAGAALLAPFAPAGAVGGFQLPPGNTRPAQGPVTPGEAPPRAAAPAPTPRPTPTPTARPTLTPEAVSPDAAPSVAAPPRPVATPPPARPTATASATPQPSMSPGAAAAPAPASPSFNPLSQDRPPLAAPEEVAAAPAQLPRSTFAVPAWWPLAAGGSALLALLGGLALLWLRRRKDEAADEPEIVQPRIERPKVAEPSQPSLPLEPPPPPAPPEDDEHAHGPLSIAVEARALTISLNAATLAYRITLTNNGAVPLGGVTIAGDMVSAHSSLAPDQQRATARSELAQQHEIERIKPGESVQVTGDFRLPFQSILAIRRGKAAMFVPLARLRVESAEGGDGAVMRTALVGQRSARPGAGLQPFRLDLGPRVVPGSHTKNLFMRATRLAENSALLLAAPAKRSA